MKICPAGVELFHADTRTDRHDEANSHVSQFLRASLQMFRVKFMNASICLYLMNLFTICADEDTFLFYRTGYCSGNSVDICSGDIWFES
jgi:hypothetical protein